jgi:acetate---CoA ligase (ADP-forming)
VDNVIDRILNPNTLAVVGASSDPEKRGYRAIATLVTDGYRGTILPINPRASEILGFKCYPSLAQAPGEIDLALVCTPARLAPDVVRECGRKGVKGALLLAGGFSESGEAGRRLEEQTVAAAREYGVRLIGPNTNGLFSARLNCNAIAWFDIPRGPLAVLANSANVILSVLTEAQVHRYFGFSTILSVGNQADIRFHEYLEAFNADSGTGAIVSYIEGFKDGPAFLAAARRVTQSKPIVMYLAGRSAEGKRAAKSHSGSLAGDYAVGSGVLRQAGVVLVTQAEHLYPVAETLTLVPPMRGRRVAVISEGGGVITVAAEALAECKLELAQLTPATQARIHAIVPAATAISNPVDHGGGTDPRAEYYGAVAQAVLEDPNIDALLLVGFFGGYTLRYGDTVAETEHSVCRELAKLMRKHGKPVVVQSHYAHFRTEALDVLRKAGVPFVRHIEVAVHCLAAAADYHQARRRKAVTVGLPAPQPRASALLAGARAAGRTALLETEARALLAGFGIPVSEGVLLASAHDAEKALAAFGDAPLALKVVSPDVLHKSDAGGVRLDVRGAEGVRAAFEAIERSVRQAVPKARITGVLATPMAARGVELIVGVVRDPQFGPVVMFGLGGIFVEALRDVGFRAVPLGRLDAEEMIAEIKAGTMLEGMRGLPPVHKEAITELLVQVSALAAAHPQIAEIDLNPVIAHAGGYTIADARVVLAAT